MLIFTWKDLFLTVEKMYNIRPEDIATYLQVDAATISKHKNGKLKKFTLDNEEIYNKLFSPNSGIVPLKWTEKELFSLLKEAVEEIGFRNVMYDLWGSEFNYNKGEYKFFVITMLERINIKCPKGLTLHDLLLKYSPLSAAQYLRDKRWNSKL